MPLDDKCALLQVCCAALLRCPGNDCSGVLFLSACGNREHIVNITTQTTWLPTEHLVMKLEPCKWCLVEEQSPVILGSGAPWSLMFQGAVAFGHHSESEVGGKHGINVKYNRM